jgi:hypothetical protein
MEGVGRLEDWKIGRMEEWKIGRVEEWMVGWGEVLRNAVFCGVLRCPDPFFGKSEFQVPGSKFQVPGSKVPSSKFGVPLLRRQLR